MALVVNRMGGSLPAIASPPWRAHPACPRRAYGRFFAVPPESSAATPWHRGCFLRSSEPFPHPSSKWPPRGGGSFAVDLSRYRCEPEPRRPDQRPHASNRLPGFVPRFSVLLRLFPPLRDSLPHASREAPPSPRELAFSTPLSSLPQWPGS